MIFKNYYYLYRNVYLLFIYIYNIIFIFYFTTLSYQKLLEKISALFEIEKHEIHVFELVLALAVNNKSQSFWRFVLDEHKEGVGLVVGTTERRAPQYSCIQARKGPT